MIETALIVHGTDSSPQANWFPWLTRKLQLSGLKVVAPQFPTPEGQDLSSWIAVLNDYPDFLTPRSILIGHSVGVPFLLHAVASLPQPIGALFLVSGFLHPLGQPEFDPLLASFVSTPFNWQNIKRNCSDVFIYNSDNDPYVPLSMGEEIARELGKPLTVIKGGGHINAASGFNKFENLLDDIKRSLFGSAALITPDTKYRESYITLVNEFKERGEKLIPFPLTFPCEDFHALVASLESHSRGLNIAPGFVANTTYWLVDSDSNIIGVSNLRHSLTAGLEREGGHIGYGIRPSQRRKGFATMLLNLTLEKARHRGLSRILLTCAKTNIGSVKTILHNGGLFESSEFLAERNEVIERYWIDL